MNRAAAARPSGRSHGQAQPVRGHRAAIDAAVLLKQSVRLLADPALGLAHQTSDCPFDSSCLGQLIAETRRHDFNVSVCWVQYAVLFLPYPSSAFLKCNDTGQASILFSLDVAVGLWPLLREGLRSSRLRPGALTRPCAS